MDCLYLGKKLNEDGVHECRLFGECKLTGGGRKLPSCDRCKSHIVYGVDRFPQRWKDPLTILDRSRSPSPSLRNLLAGRAAFLFCGGPSANSLPLEQLNQRGSFTLAVNNAAGHPRFKPQAMLCCDPPRKFSHSIWRDPGIMKFVPTPKLKNGGKGTTVEKTKGGKFIVDSSTGDSPNTWGFGRRSWFQPDESFFTEPTAAWGNHDNGALETGEEKTVCTMLPALRVLYYLGARIIFLVGVDFTMQPGTGYSFPQNRTEGAADSNNAQYRIVNDWLTKMERGGVFGRFGLYIFNCYQRSSLRAFPYLPFEQAITVVTKGVERTPDLSGWYEKDELENKNESSVLGE